MNRRNTIGAALVALAVVLFVIPAFFPVQAMLVHDTGATQPGEPELIREDGYEIVSYENLSDRGQELYVQTLENGGEYSVTQGQGAPDFSYPTSAERDAAFENESLERPGAIVIVRPEDDAALPPSDERDFGPPRDGETDEERRERNLRYDAMETRTEQPSLGALPQLLRLLAGLLAVISLGVGGYLLSSK
ncbi:MAG: hypothetical protein ABEH88_00770 [Halobacteriales archaeon]